jgi:hypothetical protein
MDIKYVYVDLNTTDETSNVETNDIELANIKSTPIIKSSNIKLSNIVLSQYYDCSYNVQYHTICQELTTKLNDNTFDNNNPDESYCVQDIESICRKLYFDEYASVLKCNDFMDDEIDINLRQIYTYFLTFTQMKEFIKTLTEKFNSKMNSSWNDDDDDNYYTFLMLFSYELFYLTHELLTSIENSKLNKSNDQLDADLLKKINEQFNLLINN